MPTMPGAAANQKMPSNERNAVRRNRSLEKKKESIRSNEIQKAFRAKLTTSQIIAQLDARLGVGQGAKKERKKLLNRK